MRSAVFAQTLSSGLSVPASGLDLEQIWDKVHIIVPSMASGSFEIQVASSVSGTYVQLMNSLSATFIVNSSIVANGCALEVPVGSQYLKVRNTSGVTDTIKTFTIVCRESF